ncbi:hypothetical protein [Polynucleobacter sp. es-MAR-4]|uniref:hypothetical protein n=1 Tax=Polynucleobacter sp. es-MAR-4 TaxID=1855655 RepID=UPI001C0ADE0A|nr:hypothetical protein [Polynucleobacter sp. es-MAR-4]MBU3637940.1 hypothetical protein [Polynucleobacter sp. es-MAR-4]
MIKRLLTSLFVLMPMTFHGQAFANEKLTYQNWVVEVGTETTEAYTVNDSNSSLGLFCGGSTCVFYLNPNLNCQPNTKNAVLMNGSTVSAALGMQCTLVGKHYFQILDPFDQVMNAVKAGGNIGFAVALQGGAFSVYRFSLNGSLPAIQRALEEASRRGQPKSSQPMPNQAPGFKDITL